MRPIARGLDERGQAAPVPASRRGLFPARQSLAALAAYLAVTLALFPTVVAHLATAFPGDLGDPPSQAWILAWDLHALTTAPLHLFEANIFYPFHDVLAYQDSLLGVLPLAVPVLLATGNPILAYNIVFLLSFALCAWGGFLLARCLVGDARAAFLAGLIFGFSPYRMIHLYHLNLLCGIWVAPALLCWEGVRRGRQRYWIGCGLFAVLQALTSLYYAAFLAVSLALLIGLHARESRRTGRAPLHSSLLRGAALTALACCAIMLPFLLPYFRVERALGGARGLGQAVYFAADLRDFLHSVDLSVLYGWSGRALGIGPSVALQYLWPGVVALGLAIWGVAGLRRDGAAMAHAARPFATLGLAAAVLCLGPFLKVWGHQTDIPLPYLLLHFLPGFAGLRDPARFGIIVTLCLALLAAYGMALLMRRYRRRAGWLAAALCAGVLAESWIRPLPTAAMPIGRALPPVYRWLAAQPAGSPVLELPAGLQNKTVWAWQAEMMLYATYHWQPIVNGTGGFTPPGYDRDAALYNAFPSPATLQLLEHRHVRFVIVHRAWVGPAVADAIARRAAAAHITRLRHWADVDVYAVPAMCVPCQVWTVHRAGYRHTRSYASS